MTSRSELEEIERIHRASFDAGNVFERSGDTLVLVVNNKRTSPLPVPPVPHLSFTGPSLSRIGDLGDVGVRGEGLEEVDSGFGLADRLNGGRDDEWHFLDLLNSVTSSENQRRESRRSHGRGDGVSLLVLVDLDVPFPPSLGRGKHSSSSAHVSKGGLTGSLGSSTTHDEGYERQPDQYPMIRQRSGDRPFQRQHMAVVGSLPSTLQRMLADLLCTRRVDSLWTCWTTSRRIGGGKDAGQGERARGVSLGGPDSDGGSSGHLDWTAARMSDYSLLIVQLCSRFEVVLTYFEG